MKFSIVIPVWRGRELLEKNLPSVLKMVDDAPGGASQAEVIVVDDASPTDDGDWVENVFKAKLSKKKSLALKVLRNERNLGFVRTVIKGVNASKGDIIVLLNQDVKPSRRILTYLEEDFQDPEVFGVSLAEQRFGPTRGLFKNGMWVHEPIVPIPKQIVETFWVNGGSGAVRKLFWDELGGFGPVFDPGYWEDIDLSFRARKRGWKILWDSRAKVEHESESTFGGPHYDQVFKRRIQERNHLIFNWRSIEGLPQWSSHIFYLLRRIISHPGYLRIVFTACIHLLMFRWRSR